MSPNTTTGDASVRGRSRRWLCISYAFPPINRSGTHRTLAFVRHLDARGWAGTVLTVESGREPIDKSLCERVPASTRVIPTTAPNLIDAIKRLQPAALHRPQNPPRHRQPARSTHANKRRGGIVRELVSQFCLTPDSRLGWIIPAVRAGLRAMRQERHELIFSTSPYPSAHLIAWVIASVTRRPWVADLRDPWVGNPFRLDRLPLVERWEQWLERKVLRRASHVTCNSPALQDRLCARFPELKNQCTCILNGFDEETFHGITPKRLASDGAFVLLHCGQFYGPRRPHVWFQALRMLRQQDRDAAGRIRLALVGSDAYADESLADIAVSFDVRDRVDILGPRSHRETLGLVAGSDALVLAGVNGAGGELQIPNKLYEYLAARKPILAGIGASNPAVAILGEAKAQAVVCPPDDAAAIARAMSQLASGACHPAADAWSGVARFERGRLAQQLVALFETLAERTPLVEPGDATASTGAIGHAPTAVSSL